MKNPPISNGTLSRLSIIAGTIPLVILLFTGLAEQLTRLSGILFLVSVAAVFAAWFALVLVCFVVLRTYLSKAFRGEYQAILARFEADGNAHQLYKKLTSMQNPPRLQDDANLLHLSCSTALSRIKRYDEALRELDLIAATKGRMLSVVQQQRADIAALRTGKKG